jgi:septum formation protein
MKLILGSQSKNRKGLMEQYGLPFEVVTPNIDEKAIRLDDPKELVLALGNAKADAVLAKINEPALVITSDQVVWHKGSIIEKPADAEDARTMLRRYDLSDPAETVTSVVVTNSESGKRREGVDVAKIWFKPFSEELIEEWIKRGTPYEHAGAFAVENEMFKPLVDRIEGELESIIGLPKVLTLSLLSEMGYKK